MILSTFTGSLPERMKKLEEILRGETAIRMVGSSFGGLMGTIFAMENEPRVKRLTLLAPAINLIEFTPFKKKTVTIPVSIYHGSADDVIPVEEVEPIARKCFTDLSFHVVDDDHFLHRTFKSINWDELLD